MPSSNGFVHISLLILIFSVVGIFTLFGIYNSKLPSPTPNPSQVQGAAVEESKVEPTSSAAIVDPTEPPKPVPTPKNTPKSTPKKGLGNCTGPDGKIIQVTFKECEDLNKFWNITNFSFTPIN